MHVCRFCKSDHKRQNMVKYAARHWAHYDCWLEAKGKELTDPQEYRQIETLLETSLHGWQMRNFPVFRMADWLEAHKVTAAPGKSWVDKACGILQRSIARAEQETVKT